MPKHTHDRFNNMPAINYTSGIDLLINTLQNMLSPSMDNLYFDASMTESDDEYVLTVRLSGFDRDDVKVELNDNYLTVKACKKNESRSRNYYMSGYSFTSNLCSNVFYVRDISVDNMTSKYEDGILTIRLPKMKKSSILNSGSRYLNRR